MKYLVTISAHQQEKWEVEADFEEEAEEAALDARGICVESVGDDWMVDDIEEVE